MLRAERPAILAGLSALMALVAAAVAPAAVCPVPSAGHPTIDSALRDPICTTAALGVHVFEENVVVERDFVLQGGGPSISVVAGTLRTVGIGTSLTLGAVRVDGTGAGVAGCGAAVVEATTGSEILGGPDVEVDAGGVTGGECRIFVDGFDGGSTLAWSAAVP